MPNALVDGLSSVDSIGAGILAATATTLVSAIAAHVFLRGRYGSMQRDLQRHGEPRAHFSHEVLNRIVREADQSAGRTGESNTQAIIEDAFQSELKPLLLAERFVRSATSLVLVLGLLGTFYGLTLSIGKLVHLVAADPGVVSDITQAVTHGLTQALTGMAVAFSNSLVGIASAVVLTVLGVLNNVADRRTALMIEIETYVDRLLPRARGSRSTGDGSVAGFAEAVGRLEGAVVRFESALARFAADTKDLREVQLVVALKPGDRR